MEKAEDVFEDVLKHDNNNITALNNIGVIYYKKKNIEKRNVNKKGEKWAILTRKWWN